MHKIWIPSIFTAVHIFKAFYFTIVKQNTLEIEHVIFIPIKAKTTKVSLLP